MRGATGSFARNGCKVIKRGGYQKVEKNERMTVVQMRNLASPGTISMHYGAKFATRAESHSACLPGRLTSRQTHIFKRFAQFGFQL